jgi:hypothetical protein
MRGTLLVTKLVIRCRVCIWQQMQRMATQLYKSVMAVFLADCIALMCNYYELLILIIIPLTIGVHACFGE